MASRAESKSKSPKKTAANLPLLDDVNELIEKEKLLLEFKVLEQQREAQEWKLKYDSLVGKVSENISDFKAIETAAEVEENVGHAQTTGLITQYVASVGPYLILDLSSNSSDFVVNQLTEGAHILKGYHPLIRAVSLRDCELTDANRQALLSLFTDNAISGFDFSHNMLGTGFEALLLDTLLVRSHNIFASHGTCYTHYRHCLQKTTCCYVMCPFVYCIPSPKHSIGPPFLSVF
jgi:hypothetical protein